MVSEPLRARLQQLGASASQLDSLWDEAELTCGEPLVFLQAEVGYNSPEDLASREQLKSLSI